jgi:hypothetical protein
MMAPPSVLTANSPRRTEKVVGEDLTESHGAFRLLHVAETKYHDAENISDEGHGTQSHAPASAPVLENWAEHG